MMKIIKGELYAYLLILLISLVFVSDIFLTNTQFASFDSPFHITNIAQFYKVIASGEFPVRWMDGFANYGLPIPLVAHQLTSYLGAFITFLTLNPLTSYHVLIFIGIFFSNLFYYQFLRIYVKSQYAFLGTFLFNFTIYRIINIYVRGAMPEVFSSIFLPLILFCVYHTFVKKSVAAAVGLVLSFFLLALNHPMMLLIYSFILFPYFLYVLLWDIDGKLRGLILPSLVKKILIFGVLLIIGIGMASYYIIPLNLEIKYFYYGLTKNHLTLGNYLSLKNAVPSLPYFTDQDIFPRGHTIGLGIIETITLILGFFYAVYKFLIEKKKEVSILEFSIGVSMIVLFFISQFSTIFYEHIAMLSNIQFQWRMLSALTFFPPLILAYLVSKLKKDYILPVIIFLICIIAFPQLYGKNYTKNPLSSYYFTTHNVHSIMMNTIWTGKTDDYPVEKQKIGTISGIGTLSNIVVMNETRSYTVSAESPMRMVDYTFYFPGWTVTIDGQKSSIEYQDPEYRGVITYNVPAGEHTVRLWYENTKVRQLATYLSFFFGFIFVLLIVMRKKLLLFIS